MQFQTCHGKQNAVAEVLLIESEAPCMNTLSVQSLAKIVKEGSKQLETAPLLPRIDEAKQGRHSELYIQVKI